MKTANSEKAKTLISFHSFEITEVSVLFVLHVHSLGCVGTPFSFQRTQKNRELGDHEDIFAEFHKKYTELTSLTIPLIISGFFFVKSVKCISFFTYVQQQTSKCNKKVLANQSFCGMWMGKKIQSNHFK